MGLIKKVCTEAFYGIASGVTKGVFGITSVSDLEVQNIEQLKKLTLSGLPRSADFSPDPSIGKGILKGSLPVLQTFLDNAPSKLVAAGAAVICQKAFRERFKDLLMGACLNLTGFSLILDK
jgi:hypothetical protein